MGKDKREAVKHHLREALPRKVYQQKDHALKGLTALASYCQGKRCVPSIVWVKYLEWQGSISHRERAVGFFLPVSLLDCLRELGALCKVMEQRGSIDHNIQLLEGAARAQQLWASAQLSDILPE